MISLLLLMFFFLFLLWFLLLNLYSLWLQRLWYIWMASLTQTNLIILRVINTLYSVFSNRKYYPGRKWFEHLKKKKILRNKILLITKHSSTISTMMFSSENQVEGLATRLTFFSFLIINPIFSLHYLSNLIH